MVVAHGGSFDDELVSCSRLSRMNRYRRSAQKSGPEATLMNTDDSIYFMCDENEEKLTKPNIISKTASSNSPVQKFVPAESNRSKQQQESGEGNIQPGNEVVQPAKNETGPIGNSQCVYYHLEDGSLAVVDLSSLIADGNAGGVQMRGASQESQLSSSLLPKSDVGLMQPVENSTLILNGGIQDTGLAIKSESANGELPEGSKQLFITNLGKESLSEIDRLSTELNYSKTCSGGTMENEMTTAEMKIPVSVQGSCFQEVQEQKDCGIDNDQQDQFVLLMVGNKTVYVSATAYQQYCIAQETGDVESSVNFLSQVEQALGVPTGDLISQYGNVEVTPQSVTSDEQVKVLAADPEPQRCTGEDALVSAVDLQAR